ncbi:MAG: type II toxin-antitoxin system Phd/YefM family antitoxin [Chloracidobacterium sp.]|nr:type II toxin-antitoxin system Phd/YefM family antitoxin [Chloracidobacterium sp.]MCC6825345.1 type II toxin-antitoxin system Phd/YefM family antitoxin [Acidobacteriota bacterium]MCO5333156.1 type II toxin-antitoxin system Phd/YefM family antitoxin [Pyrinomonadaceae bacterium]
MNLTEDIQSLSVFKRDTAKFMRRMKKTQRPMVLTVNGKPALVVHDAVSYEKFARERDRLEAIEGIRRGLEDVEAGRVQEAEEFFREFEAKYGIADNE